MTLPALLVEAGYRALDRRSLFAGRDRRARRAMAALDIGGIKVEPAPLVEVAATGRAIAVVVVAFTVELRQRFAGLRQRTEHGFAPGHIGAATVGGHGVDAQGIERVPFRGHQVPAAIAFFSAKEALGLERRAVADAAELVQLELAALTQPALELLLFTAGSGLELIVADDLFRPAAAGGLAIAVDQTGVHGLLQLVVILGADALDEDALGDVGFVHRQGHRHHLLEINLAGTAGQQHPLAFMHPRHRRPGTHALA
ncbi:hypothetical protein D3C81_848100 [compost metagenome]